MANFAVNSFGQGKVTPDLTAAVIQLNTYNTELLKEKQNLLEELKKLRADYNEKTKKLESFDMATRKSLLFMKQLT